MVQSRTILWFSDGQVKSGVPMSHFSHLGKLVQRIQPNIIICGGDHWDFPSITEYTQFKKQGEGLRLKRDIEAGTKAMDLFMEEATKVSYRGQKFIFLEGNHEERLERMMDKAPWLYELFSIRDFVPEQYELYRFGDVLDINGVLFSHYFKNRGSHRPVGGSISNRLNKIKRSFVQGHEQVLLYERYDKPDGQAISGLVCGAFHQHDEGYLGPQRSGHFRGIAILHDVKDCDYDLELWSINRLRKEFR